MRWKRTTPLRWSITFAVVPDREHVRDRHAGRMGQRDVEVGEAATLRPGRDLAVQVHDGAAAALVEDLDVGPAHPFADAGAEGLQYGLLRREANGQVLDGPPLAAAVVLLCSGEHRVDD